MANNGELHQDLDAIRTDLAQLRSDLSTAMRGMMDAGKEKAGDLRDKAVDTGKRAIEATETQIKERPFLSILVVFLIGILLGKMFDQRMRG
jgi:ElaB/YqjD/DUF883 family membrane-anchored ribosome-binding protein